MKMLILDNTQITIDPASGEIYHHPDFRQSVLGQLKSSIVHNYDRDNIGTSIGMGGPKLYVNGLIDNISPEIINIGDRFFIKLSEEGAIINPKDTFMYYSYADLLNARSIEIGQIIMLLANDIAVLQKKDCVTLETMEKAYRFFLCDLQRYLEIEAGTKIKNVSELEPALKYFDGEKLLDCRIHDVTVRERTYKLITNQRLFDFDTSQRKVLGEIPLLKGESKPLLINDWNPSKGGLFYQTNMRLIWEYYRLFKGHQYVVCNLANGDVIKQIKYFQKSKLLLVISQQSLMIWFEDTPVQQIELSEVSRIIVNKRKLNKKTLFVSREIEQNQLTIFCPGEKEINIDPKDLQEILIFLEPINRI
jgi:hypothetical protein